MEPTTSATTEYQPSTITTDLVRAIQDRAAATIEPARPPLVDLITTIERRAEAGFEKYGHTMDRSDLSLGNWVNHLIEELIDAAQYAAKIRRIHQTNAPHVTPGVRVTQEVVDLTLLTNEIRSLLIKTAVKLHQHHAQSDDQ